MSKWRSKCRKNSQSSPTGFGKLAKTLASASLRGPSPVRRVRPFPLGLAAGLDGADGLIDAPELGGDAGEAPDVVGDLF
jgi:hypothetical protein